MFIETEPTATPASLKFLPGQAVLATGTAEFQGADKAAHSPLAQRLFEIEGVVGVTLDAQSITLKKSDEADWQVLKPLALGAIMDHFTAGGPALLDDQDTDGEAEVPLEDEDADPEVIAKIKELIDTRIRPAATQDGGDVMYRGFKDGVVLLEMVGPGAALKGGIDNMLRHYVPQVTGVADYRDAMPKPGLESEEARIVQKLLDESINPAVAAHGGHIALVDVQDDTVYIRLEGGCQGCGMADVTLKQGVTSEIQTALPQITNVLDTTDHAGGANPYFEAGKGGSSPL